MSVKRGMTAKQIAVLHYQLLMKDKKTQWLKTIRKRLQDQAERYGSSPYFWWKTGRKRVDEQKFQYKYKNKDERYSTKDHIKFFFHRLDEKGKPAGTGQVPIHVIRDPDDSNEWRVDVSSW